MAFEMLASCKLRHERAQSVRAICGWQREASAHISLLSREGLFDHLSFSLCSLLSSSSSTCYKTFHVTCQLTSITGQATSLSLSSCSLSSLHFLPAVSVFYSHDTDRRIRLDQRRETSFQSSLTFDVESNMLRLDQSVQVD